MDHVHGMLDELEGRFRTRTMSCGAWASARYVRSTIGWATSDAPWNSTMRLGDRAGARSLASRLWNFWDRGLVLTSLGRYEEALEWLHRHAELCRRVGDLGFWSARSLNTAGWTYLQINAWDEGRRANEEGLEAAHRMEDPEIVRNAPSTSQITRWQRAIQPGPSRLLVQVESPAQPTSREVTSG